MTTTQYDKPWPEDSYKNGELAAYKYILTKLPGQSPPKNGTYKQPAPIQIISYPANAGFTEKEFKTVKDHLILEVSHFATAADWFDPNGIIDAVNRGVAILSSNDLIDAANLMSIPTETIKISMILDEIFGVVFWFLAVLPAIGPAIAAVSALGWTIAKSQIGTQKPSEPSEEVIAQIAGQLNQYLNVMTNSAQAQREILYGNWGKLEEFYIGVVEGKISERQFFGPGPSQTEDNNIRTPTTLEANVRATAASAWLAYCYRKLFTVSHRVSSLISFAEEAPNNPWNPAAGEYHFTWYLPCKYRPPGKSDKIVLGYMVFDCSTDAPPIVMEQLFGADSILNVNPIDFFAGFNGWPSVLPTYDAGYQGTNTDPAIAPVRMIGLPFWEKSFQGR